MAQSTVAVYNRALAWLGGQQLSQVESTWEKGTFGALCRESFPSVLNTCLSRQDWSFAIKRVTLPLKPGLEPHPQYACRYGIPTDCLRISDIGGGPSGSVDWVVEGIDLYTDQNPVQLKYVGRITDPSQWPAMFEDALVFGLAAALAAAKLNDTQKQQLFLEKTEQALNQAMAFDRNVQRPTPVPSRWNQARGGFGKIK